MVNNTFFGDLNGFNPKPEIKIGHSLFLIGYIKINSTSLKSSETKNKKQK